MSEHEKYETMTPKDCPHCGYPLVLSQEHEAWLHLPTPCYLDGVLVIDCQAEDGGLEQMEHWNMRSVDMKRVIKVTDAICEYFEADDEEYDNVKRDITALVKNETV